MRLKDMITMRKNKCDEDRKNPSFSDFWKGYHEGWYCAYRDLEEILEQKRLDVEIVVRCKDCSHSFILGEEPELQKEAPYKYYRKDVLMCGCEELFGDYPESVDAMFFCGHGEKKDGE